MRWNCPLFNRSKARGFTLLEVMIALVITLLAVGVLIAAAGGTLQTSRNAARYEQATLRAQSRLTALVHGAPLAAGDRQGDDGGGYHWHERVAQVMAETQLPSAPDARRWGLYSVEVWVSWRDGLHTRDVHLATEAVGSAS